MLATNTYYLSSVATERPFFYRPLQISYIISNESLPPGGHSRSRVLHARSSYAEVPPRVEYKLSGLGNTLRRIISAMETWGLGYQDMVKNTPEEGG